MAKKKNRKKHNFKYATSSGTNRAAAPAEASTPAARQSVTPVAAAAKSPVINKNLAVGDDLSYVTKDLSKVAVLAAAFTALELILWYLFNHTGLGTQVYHLIRL